MEKNDGGTNATHMKKHHVGCLWEIENRLGASNHGQVNCIWILGNRNTDEGLNLFISI